MAKNSISQDSGGDSGVRQIFTIPDSLTAAPLVFSRRRNWDLKISNPPQEH